MNYIQKARDILGKKLDLYILKELLCDNCIDKAVVQCRECNRTEQNTYEKLQYIKRFDI